MISHLSPLVGLVDATERQVFASAIGGDSLSIQAVLDIVQERGIEVNPFTIGKAYYVETLTLYYVGEVVESHPTWVRMRRVSWVHWTGRKSTLFRRKSFKHEHFTDGDSKPRTEYMGDFCLSLAGVNGWEEWPLDELPEGNI